MKFLQSLFLLGLLWMTPLTATAAVSQEAAPLSLATEGIGIRIQPKGAWTIDRIDFKNQQLTAAGGFYGLTMDLASGKFVGTGHSEGGREEVLSVDILCDGKTIDPLQGGQVTGKEFTVTKTSKVASTTLKSVLRVNAERLDAEQFLHIDQDIEVTKIYAFMYPWSLETTEWIGESIGGKALEGIFKPFVENSKQSLWEMTENVRWSAIYNPVKKIAALTTFAADSQSGDGLKHAYWNQKGYHKQYYQAVANRRLKAGEDFHWAMTLRPIPITGDDWKAEVRRIAGPAAATPSTPKSAKQLELEKRFPAYQPGEKPAWMTKRAGIEALDPNTVLKPWKPIGATTDEVTVWNRHYRVGAWGLPEQIKIGNADFLQGPLHWEVQVNNDTLSPGAELKEKFAGRANYSAGATAGNAHFQANTAYEYDGFIRCDVGFESPQPIQATRMELVIPFKPENALYFSTIFNSSEKMESQQQKSQARAIPAGEGEVFATDFKPLIWIGNRDAGVCWFSQSPEFWFPENDPKAIRILRYPDRVELRIAMIAAPTQLPARGALSFGFMATPTKPLPDDWRSWTYRAHHRTDLHAADAATQANEKPTTNMVIYWHDSWRIVLMYPEPRDREAFIKEVDFLKKNGAQRVFPYTVASHISGSEKVRIPGEDFVFTTPEWAAFGKEWELKPNRTPEDFRRMSPATSFADYHLAKLQEWTELGVNGVYVDEAYPYPDMVAEHGMGYVDRSDVRRPTYQIYAMRDYFKRMSYIFQQNADGRPAIIAHASGVLSMPHLSFVDIFLDGEQLYHSIRDWKEDRYPSYIEMLPLDRWGAEFTARQFGFAPLFLPEFRPDITKRYGDLTKAVAPTREMLALTLLHDVPVWPLFCNVDEVRATQRIQAEFGLGDTDTTFFPYWEKNAASRNGSQVMASTYTNSKGALVAVSNLGKTAQEVTVDLQGIIKPQAGWHAWNPQTRAVLPLTSTSIKVAVPARDFALIRVGLND